MVFEKYIQNKKEETSNELKLYIIVYTNNVGIYVGVNTKEININHNFAHVFNIRRVAHMADLYQRNIGDSERPLKIYIFY